MRKIAFWLSLILIFMIPWENSVTIGSLGTLTRVTGLLVAAAWVGAVLITGGFREPRLFHLVAYLFIVWNIVSIFWSFGIDWTLQRVQTYLQLFGLTLILWDLYSTPAALRSGMQAYVLGAFVAVGSTVLNYISNVQYFVYSEGRYAGAGLDPNDLALILALGLPIAWHLAVSRECGIKGYFWTFINAAFLPAAFFAILLTASRMGLFVTVTALLFMLGSFPRLRLVSRVFIVVAFIALILALQPHIPQSSLDRLATIGPSIAAGDLGGRMYLWQLGIATYLDHPFLGISSGGFQAMISENLSSSGTVVHSTFLSVLVELGIVGFVLFVIILVITVYAAMRQPTRISRLWLTILLIWAIGALALNWEFRKPTWLFFTLALVSANHYEQPDESGSERELRVDRFWARSSAVARLDRSAYPQSFGEQ